MSTWAIVPLKRLDSCKTRLAPVLTATDRAALAEAMAADVLAVLQRCHGVHHLLLVSSDPVAKAIAEDAGAEWFNAKQGGELNADLTLACHYARERGASDCLVIHADVPLLDAAAVDELLMRSRSDAIQFDGRTLTVVPCRQSRGSNLLYATLPLPVPLAYGENSFSKYRKQATEQGCHFREGNAAGVELDVDEAADLELLKARLAEVPLAMAVATRQALLSLKPLSFPVEEESVFTEEDVLLSDTDTLRLVERSDMNKLMADAAALTQQGFGSVITYSRKVFIPLTRLCRDVCHYCTFATVPRQLESPFMTLEEAVDVAQRGAELGCKEALLTLGEKPELRYRVAREALAAMGFSSTLEYVAQVARAIRERTGLLPHINAGNMTASELAMLRPVAPSMGLMLESAAERLCQPGMPHYGSPDKHPKARLQTLELAGQAQIPFTSGILVGIGETRKERIESLLALRRLHRRYGHLQEIIIQNFRAKPETLMAQASEPDLEELCWTIAVARLIFGPTMSIQVPPNLSRPQELQALIAAGINDWGGVSPLTPDYVNPEAPWPELERLAESTHKADRVLQERLTVYPRYIESRDQWLDPKLHAPVLALTDGQGLAREDRWVAGTSHTLPEWVNGDRGGLGAVDPAIARVLARVEAGGLLTEAEVASLFEARGDSFWAVCDLADTLRRDTVGESVTFVKNRNINYSNICTYHCKFCAFSKGSFQNASRDTPYRMDVAEIARRAEEAWCSGGTEVCLQGGIHPEYTGETYREILKAIRARLPNIHIHAFSPLEVWQGAATLGLPLDAFLRQLKAAGLNTLPGTAAEILDDEVRAQLCADKLTTEQWLQVMETAHRVGLRSTATIMFGHVDNYQHWARHLLRVRKLQVRTGGFSEFVPLPFVAAEAPIFRRGQSRRGPTLREAVLMHAVSRLVLHPVIANIQTSWVKMGAAGAELCLQAGANDLGGVLMNESITRAAGAKHGQVFNEAQMQTIAEGLDRPLVQRDTLYRILEDTLLEHSAEKIL